MNCNSARQVIQIFVFGNKGTLVLKQGVISQHLEEANTK